MHRFTNNNQIALVLIAAFISSCGVPPQSSPFQITAAPAGTSNPTPTDANTPEVLSTSTPIPTQSPISIPDWQLVWADEFDGTEIDQTRWSYDTGPSNDCIHYYTERQDNARVTDGVLQIIALEEPYNGFNYTAALLRTRQPLGWRYGRVEARIKLPVSNGFVPAFWMLPVDDLYGWWPMSGEIDIMEHPTNQVEHIYGSVHTGAYSAFTGSSSQGGVIEIEDAETEFHVYAIEWSEEKIEFYVDDLHYFTFQNDHDGHETWPFNQPFYLILNLAVGGGWVGNPDSSSIFPAAMEVDFVRVYQDIRDFTISGLDFVTADSRAFSYSAPYVEGLIYRWSVPDGAAIILGQGSSQAEVEWGSLGGNIDLEMVRADGVVHTFYPVEVTGNLVLNGGFEKGVKYWRKIGLYPNARFGLTSEDVHQGAYALYVENRARTENAWDVQLSQRDILLRSGERYQASLWARAEGSNPIVSVAVVDTEDFSLYGIRSVELSNEWTQYDMPITLQSDAAVSLNIDMGEATGTIYIDDLEITAR